jgi:gliding motility-associated-like protein
VKDNFDVEKLFKEKFESFEPAVNAKVWENVAANVASNGAASGAVASSALWVKSIIVGAVATVVGLGAWVYFDNEETNEVSENQKVVPAEQPMQSFVDDHQIVEVEESRPELNYEQKHSQQPTISTEKQVLKARQNNQQLTTNNTKSVSNTVESANQNRPSEVQESADQKEMNTIAETNILKTTSGTVENHQKESEPINDGIHAFKGDSAMTGQRADDIKQQADKVADHEQENSEESYISNIPNIFTPNNDNINDEFFIEDLANIEAFYIVIYTKSNVKVYESADANFRWDGFNMYGNKVRPDVYYYLIKAVGVDGKTHSIPGQITVR